MLASSRASTCPSSHAHALFDEYLDDFAGDLRANGRLPPRDDIAGCVEHAVVLRGRFRRGADAAATGAAAGTGSAFGKLTNQTTNAMPATTAIDANQRNGRRGGSATAAPRSIFSSSNNARLSTRAAAAKRAAESSTAHRAP